MKIFQRAALLLFPLFAVAAHAADEVDIAALKKQVQELDFKVRMLEHQQDNDVAAQKVMPKISLGGGGFAFTSAETNFAAQLHGLIQVDSRSFFNDGNTRGTDGFLLRKARPIFSGTLFHDFDFNFTSELGGSTVQIMDAYLNYRFRPELQFQIGKFKSPVGLEMLQGDANTLFNERSIANNLIPNRDLGLMLKGEVAGGLASYAVGVFNGAPDYSSTGLNSPVQDTVAFAGRVFFMPFKKTKLEPLRGLGFGVGGSYEVDHPVTNSATGLTSGYVSDGQQKFFAYKGAAYANGQHWRITPQASYYWGPFGLMGEYVISDQIVRNGAVSTELQNAGWEVSASWVLTGEAAAYTGIAPKKSFDPRKGQWGALQLVARYGELTVDDAAFPTFADRNKSASEARSWAVGLNWYLNKSIRANASFSRTDFGGFTGSTPAVATQPENVVFTRVQVAF